jgi:hypothetical protein
VSEYLRDIRRRIHPSKLRFGLGDFKRNEGPMLIGSHDAAKQSLDDLNTGAAMTLDPNDNELQSLLTGSLAFVF